MNLSAGKMALSVPIKYRVSDLPKLQKKYRPGQHITVMQIREDGEERQKYPQRKEYIIVETYPRHVSCVDLYGHRESFDYIKLEQSVV